MGLRSWAGLAMLTLALAGCGGDDRGKAAKDVRALLTAAETGDRAAFESHVDRPALRADLKRQLLDSPEVRDLQAQMGDEVGDVAVDQLITPATLRGYRASHFKSLAAKPGAGEVRGLIAITSNRQACVRDGKAKTGCLLTFEQRDKTWKLVGLEAGDLKMESYVAP